MTGPRVTENDFVERTGILKVELIAVEARCVWRETPLRDVGIDGQLEYVTPAGEATGRLVGVQVKSGPSYFRGSGRTPAPYPVSARHVSYWERFALPVILVLHEPGSGLTVWTDARAALRQGINPIEISATDQLNARSMISALATTGPLPSAPVDAGTLIAEMVGHICDDVTFLDLFVQGMTDLARSVYFNVDLIELLLERKASEAGLDGFGMGAATFEFLDEYVAFLVAHDIARVDFDAFRQTMVERDMLGCFIAPLTNLGRRLVDSIEALNKDLVPDNPALTVERPVQLLVEHDFDERSEGLRRLMMTMQDRDGS